MNRWTISSLTFLLMVGLSLSQTETDDVQKKIDSIFKPIADRNMNADACECIPYYLCRENNTIIRDGEGVFSVRIDEDDPLNPCQSYMHFCCKKDDQLNKPIIPAPLPPRNGCGYTHPDGVGFRTTGGTANESKFGEFPWMVAIITFENASSASYKCGGALIHPRAVITSAHCVGDHSQYHIRAGEWDTQTTLEIFPHQEVTVQRIIIHPKFYSGGLHNDIALLILEEAVEYKDHIDGLCLPHQDYIVPDMTECIATGWGRDTFEKEGKYQVILKKIALPIMERDRCESTLRTTRLGKYFLLDKSFICAGGVDGRDTCEGDGGSPLICPIPGQKDRYLHAGIVAWGIDCGMDGIPGVYANVALFRDWIDEQMLMNDLDLTEYQY